MTMLPTDLKSGHSALLQCSAGRFRAEALGLSRRPVDEADARMVERKRTAVSRERVLIRCRAVWTQRGFFRVPEQRFDVFHVNGRVQSVVAVGCVWWEEAVSLAKDALRGRVSVAFGGSRTSVATSGPLAVASSDVVGVRALTPDEGAGWRRPAPGEVLEVKR